MNAGVADAWSIEAEGADTNPAISDSATASPVQEERIGNEI